MSSVVPKDLTGMVPHPTKLDCWIPGERAKGDNLCMETPLPTGGTSECTINSFGNCCDFNTLTVIHLVQIKDALWERGGGPEDKIIQSYPFGATRDQELPQSEVEQYAEMAIKMNDGDVKEAADRIEEILINKLIGSMPCVTGPEDANPTVPVIDSTPTDTPAYSIDPKVFPYMEPPKRKALEVFNEISINWKVQIYNNVQRRYGGSKANLIVDGEVGLLTEEMVEEFTNELLTELGGTPKQAAVLLKNYMEEHITMMSAFAMHESMKGNGQMQELTKAVDAEVNKFKLGEGNAQELSDLITNTPSVDSNAPKPEQFVNPKHVHRKKKKKGAKRRHHLSMGDKSTKRILGASLLHRLGTIQQQHTDATKKALLKELPMADLVEVATGEKLPDYQANLLNMMQAKADPSAPIVSKVQSGTVPYIKQHVDIVNQMLGKTNTQPYVKALDEVLDAYISEDRLPDGVDEVNLKQVKDALREHMLEKRKAEVLEDLQDETANVLELTEQFEDSIPLVRIEWDDRGEQFFIKRSAEEEFAFEVVDIFNAVAEELGSPVTFVDQIARGKDYLKGLNRAIIENLQGKVFDELEEINGAVKSVYERVVVSYTVGFVKGVAASTAKVASNAAVESTPAELG